MTKRFIDNRLKLAFIISAWIEANTKRFNIVETTNQKKNNLCRKKFYLILCR